MAAPTQAVSARWRTFAVYAVLGPILGAVLPAVLAVAVLTQNYAGPLWGGSAVEWISLIGSAALEGLIPAVLTVIALQTLPGRALPRIRSAVAYGLISAISALFLLLPFKNLDETGYLLFAAATVLGASGLIAGLLCAAVVQRLSPMHESS